MDPDHLRRRSKQLFGNRYRLEIGTAIAVAAGDLVYALEVSKATGITHNIVSGQLKEFVAAGVMDDGPAVDGQRYRYFRRLPSSFWDLCKTVCEEFGRETSKTLS